MTASRTSSKSNTRGIGGGQFPGQCGRRVDCLSSSAEETVPEPDTSARSGYLAYPEPGFIRAKTTFYFESAYQFARNHKIKGISNCA